MGASSFLTAKVAFDNKALSHSNRWRKRKKHLIILDWDDTLMCTSFLVKAKFSPSQEEREKINQLGSLSNQFMTMCKKNGDVFLVTNSASEWVHSSVRLYFPNEKDILKGIEIYPNRDKYANYPASEWKEKAFADIEPHVRLCSNILCIGDSEPDVNEGKKLQKKYPDTSVTTIKLRAEPTVEAMINQMNYLINNFSFLFKYPANIDIQNERELKL